MRRLPTVLLEHRTARGRHYDWLLGDPGNRRGRLWTARIRIPSNRWRSSRSWALTPIAPHRRRYLTYEGPLTAGRGSVRRVDKGTHMPVVWTATRIVVDVKMKRCVGRIELRKLAGGRWRGRMVFA